MPFASTVLIRLSEYAVKLLAAHSPSAEPPDAHLERFIFAAKKRGARPVYGDEFHIPSIEPGEPLWWIVRGTLEIPVSSDADANKVFDWARDRVNAGFVSHVWIPAMRAAQPGYHAYQGYLMPMVPEPSRGQRDTDLKASGLNIGGLAPDSTTSEEQKKVYRGLGARIWVMERDWYRSDSPGDPHFADLPEPAIVWGRCDGSTRSKRHGTADLSILAMNPDNLNFGGGIAPYATYLLLAAGEQELGVGSDSGDSDSSSSIGILGTPMYNALAWCVANCERGDIVLIEEQVLGCPPSSSVPSIEACVDLDYEMRELLTQLCDRGAIPILPAGNGNRDLSLLTPPSHPSASVNPIGRPPGIRVGAVKASSGKRGGSNYGPLVQVCSWGTNVAALGWVEDPPNPASVGWMLHSGTSAASAIIAGAAAVAQAMYKAKNNDATLDVHGMLALLGVGASTTESPFVDQVGFIPNMGAIRLAIEAGWTWPPPPPPQS